MYRIDISKKAFLALEDGTIYHGSCFGAGVEACGEVVFCTSMIGYQEMLTDPSYAGQILVPTYPLIGNYGINEDDIESSRIQVSGLVVREQCMQPSHYLSSKTIDRYLAESGIPGISGIDTRALARRLRISGVMMGVISSERTPEEAVQELRRLPGYGCIDYVRRVTTPSPYRWQAEGKSPLYHIVVLDCGLKYNILRILNRLGCNVTAVPCTTTATEILCLKPDGILISPGPGNPELLDYIVVQIRQIIAKKPIMGICLGNQLIARTFGARTYKLKFGHRGGNHPVRELASGKIHITAQNHGYAIDPDTLHNGLEITHVNLNDGTVEGLQHRELPIFSIQYHSEASPGPWDNTYLFNRFLEMVKESQKTCEA